MMKKVKTALSALTLVAGFGLATQVHAATYTIDFDTLPDGSAMADGSALNNQYSDWGVTFSRVLNGTPVPGLLASNAPTIFANAPVSGNALYYRSAAFISLNDDVIRIDFDSGVSGIEFDFIPYGSFRTSLNTKFVAYDAANNVLFSTRSGQTSFFNFHYTGLSSLSGVTRLEIVPVHYRTMSHIFRFRYLPLDIDNLKFTTSSASPSVSVPEPGTLALFGLGLVGLGALRRRKTAS